MEFIISDEILSIEELCTLVGAKSHTELSLLEWESSWELQIEGLSAVPLFGDQKTAIFYGLPKSVKTSDLQNFAKAVSKTKGLVILPEPKFGKYDLKARNLTNREQHANMLINHLVENSKIELPRKLELEIEQHLLHFPRMMMQKEISKLAKLGSKEDMISYISDYPYPIEDFQIFNFVEAFMKKDIQTAMSIYQVLLKTTGSDLSILSSLANHLLLMKRFNEIRMLPDLTIASILGISKGRVYYMKKTQYSANWLDMQLDVIFDIEEKNKKGIIKDINPVKQVLFYNM